METQTRIVIDQENNTEEFYGPFEAWIAEQKLEKEEGSDDTWLSHRAKAEIEAELSKLPGWDSDDAPDFAPHPVLLQELKKEIKTMGLLELKNLKAAAKLYADKVEPNTKFLVDTFFPSDKEEEEGAWENIDNAQIWVYDDFSIYVDDMNGWSFIDKEEYRGWYLSEIVAAHA